MPLHNVDFDSQRFRFGADVTLETIPEWLSKDQYYKNAGSDDPIALTGCTCCLAHDYKAPEAEWDSLGRQKVELSYLANLALWLQRPGPTRFYLAFHAVGAHAGQGQALYAVRRYQRCDPFLCHPNDADGKIRMEDLQPAANLYAALVQLPRSGALWTAVVALVDALLAEREEIRHLLLWIALEALFGPEDGHEITYRLSQRIAFFLEEDREEARRLFSEAKKAYGFRSKVAHGTWEKNKESTQLTAVTESLIRRSVLRLLTDRKCAESFRIGREAYLDGLPFSPHVPHN